LTYIKLSNKIKVEMIYEAFNRVEAPKNFARAIDLGADVVDSLAQTDKSFTPRQFLHLVLGYRIGSTLALPDGEGHQRPIVTVPVVRREKDGSIIYTFDGEPQILLWQTGIPTEFITQALSQTGNHPDILELLRENSGPNIPIPYSYDREHITRSLARGLWGFTGHQDQVKNWAAAEGLINPNLKVLRWPLKLQNNNKP
jgi:hypothetical protein